MDVSDEAKRIMASAVEKLKHSRSQRGGLRLHRTLLLTLAIRSARDLFVAAQTVMETQMMAEPSGATSAHLRPLSSARGEEVQLSPRDTSCGGPNRLNVCLSSSVEPFRNRRAKASPEPDFLPYKKSRLGQDNGSQLSLASPG